MLNTSNSSNNDDYSGPLSIPNRIIYNQAIIDANTNENDVQTHSKLGSLDVMNNQGFASCLPSKCNDFVDKSLNKVVSWLNNSDITTEDKTARDLSNKNYHFRDCYIDANNPNESSNSVKTVSVNGKSLEERQSKNDEQVNNIFGPKHSKFYTFRSMP